MEKAKDDILLQNCLLMVEQKVNWGSGDQWTTKDFESLSEKIFGETKVRISVTTLKRLWGKMAYDSRPTATTLNAIARFVGYENWRAFAASQPGVRSSVKTQSPPKRNRIVIAVVIIVAAIATIFLLKGKSDVPKSASEYSFKSSVVTQGIPNSVLFEYDATAAGTDDTIYIQQSWDARLRQQVSRNDKSHNSIYYYPGFFQAKLVVDNQIVKEDNLYIKSQGWLPLVEQPKVPVYFTEADGMKEGVFELSAEKINSKNIAMQPDVPWVAYYYVDDLEDLRVGNFSLETLVKNNFNEGSGICQNTEIIVLYESSAILIPLSIKGCVSNLGTKNKTNLDLTALGCDFSKWVKVRCEVVNGVGSVFVNDAHAYDFKIDAPTEKVVGLTYRFQGTGGINSVSLKNTTGTVVYENNF